VIGLAAGVVALALIPTAAGATASLRVTRSVAPTVSASMPPGRLHSNAPVRASALPALATHPRLATTWQQIGPREVQAVVAGSFAPLVEYILSVPTQVHCAKTCTFTAVRPHATSVAANVTWEEQLLATLHYLPVTFAASTPVADPAQATPGTFTWAYPQLPARLSAQWRVGADNVILRGALMAFQSNHALATTGVADPATWNALVTAVAKNDVDPHAYNYVDVTETSPETLTLYVGGVAKFHTLVNTGVPGAVTDLGTYPVYYRYVTQIMRGTNLDGSKYADQVSWVSYFHGGDALHQFYRYSYGFPQSLGCVEMTMDAAKFVWPFTPIGTLVTVR
jgi:hypothetical protein